MPAASRRLPQIRLDPRLPAPAYLQIFHQVQRQSTAGRLRPGERLPTVRALAVQLGVNFNTVARAYRLLKRAGIVSPQQGRGTFLLSRSSDSAQKRITLESLAAQFVAEARRYGLNDSQIADILARRLRSRRTPEGAGERYG